MRQLGDWLKSIRAEKGLDLKELALETGMDFGQISRIENQKSDLTLSSIVRLVYGLDLSLPDLMVELELTGLFPRLQKLPDKQTSAITIIDVEAFWNYYRDEAQRAKGWLYDHYHHIRSINPELDGEEIRPEDSFNIVGEALNADDAKHQALPIPYPKGLTRDQLDEVYIAGGVITLKDLGAYSRILRKNKGLSLRAYADDVSVTYTAVHRLEKGYIDRILFKEIVESDQKLGASGTLLSIGWAAGEFHTGIIRNRAAQQKIVNYPKVDPNDYYPPFEWDPQQLAFAETLVTICRWYQKLMLDDIAWLREMRNLIQFYTL